MSNKKYKNINLAKLSNIPDDWDIKTTKETLYIKGRIGWKGLKKSEFIKEGPYLVTGMHFKGNRVDWDQCFHITEERYEESPEIKVQKGDVLLTKDGTIGKVAYIDSLPGQASLNSHLLLLRPLRDNQLNSKFLFYILQGHHFRSYINMVQSGSTFGGLSQTNFEKYAFPSPPIKEQQKIAAILSTIDEAIEKTEQIIEQTFKVKKGLIQQLLTKGIGHTKFKKNPIGEIPKTWELKKLGNLAEVIDSKHYTPTYTEEGIPIIRTNDIKPTELQFSNNYFTSENDYAKLVDKYVPKKGDIVYAREGSFGVASYVNTDQRFSIGQRVVVINVQNIDGRFLYLTLNAHKVFKQVLQASLGTTVKRINVKDIKGLLIPIPAPKEQQKITETIKPLEDKIEVEKEKYDRLSVLKKGLMQQLFTGKTRVPIDDEDEVMPT